MPPCAASPSPPGGRASGDKSLVRGLLLDLDGTLADSIAALKTVYLDFLAGFGIAGSPEGFAALNGPPLAEVVARLRETHGLTGSPAELLARYRALVDAAHGTAPPAEGAETLLRQARAEGWRIAVVTSSPRAAALGWLERTGLAPLIDAVVGGDEVAAGKPAPAPYHLGIERLGCRGENSLAIEDSRQGTTAARAAGLETLAIAAPDDREDWPPGVRFIARLADAGEFLRR